MPDHAVPPRSHRVGDVAFTVMPLSRAIDLVMTASHSVGAGDLGHPGLAVHFCNAYNVALAAQRSRLRPLLSAADVVFSDGVPITWVGRRAYPARRRALERRVRADVMRGVLDRSDGERSAPLPAGRRPPRPSTPCRRSIAPTTPAAVVAGAESPPFRLATADELAARDARIRDSGATHRLGRPGDPQAGHEVAAPGCLPARRRPWRSARRSTSSPAPSRRRPPGCSAAAWSGRSGSRASRGGSGSATCGATRCSP